MRSLVDVAPTPEQLTLISTTRQGVEIIRGAAGSGKTTTAVLKLRTLINFFVSRKSRLNSLDPINVLVLTYNRTLSGYINELVSEKTEENASISLEISTFAKWARRLVGKRNMYENTTPFLESRAHFLNLNKAFVAEEAEYVMGRFLPSEIQNYLTVRREGRGNSPRMEKQQRQLLIDKVINAYDLEKNINASADWNDMAVLMATRKYASYDIIITDETQDFSANQIRAIMNQIKDSHTVVFILDSVQRIYARGFTWQEIGINIRPENSFRLRKNYRNTKQIARFAAGVLNGISHDEDGTAPDFQTAENDGNLPIVIVGRYKKQVNYSINDLKTHIGRNETIAFLHMKGGGWFDFLQEKLVEEKLDFVKISREEVWPRGNEQIALSTLHSAKGLEFDHVYIIGLNEEVLEHGEGDEDSQVNNIRRLIAMGIGRARKTVVIGYSDKDMPFVSKYFEDETYNLVRL